jgi:GT2 family glycosyltransferase
MRMTVAVLIVNWNGGALLKHCLESLQRQLRPPDHIIVVDNASTDDSLARANLRDVELIRLTENAGFARANNIAARAAAQYDALALLNPDAFAHPGWLQALVDAASAHPDVAAFASQIRLADSPDYLDGAGDSYHVSGRAWRIAHLRHHQQWPARGADVFAPCAAAALYRRAAFEEIGGFDERFFCYFEDVDLGFRLRLRGHRSIYVPGAIVHHVSSALSGYRSDFAVYHGERNAVWTYVKDMPSPLLWAYFPQHIALNVAALLYYPTRGQGRAVWRAKWDAIRGLPAVLKQRRLLQTSRRIGAMELRRAMLRGLMRPYVRRYSGPALATRTRDEEPQSVDDLTS